jgi:hypothetical protein
MGEGWKSSSEVPKMAQYSMASDGDGIASYATASGEDLQ